MSKPRNILVTSALPYANGSIHLGHLVEYIQTDIWVRYQKILGNKCYYMCADDTHGTAIMLSAKKQGIAPEALINNVHAEHFEDFKAFHIEFDNYYSTHSEENRKLAEYIYTQAKEKNAIYEKEIEQYFCDHCNIFLPDRFIKGTCPICKAENQYGDNCESCSATYSATSLINPRCAECGQAPVMKKSRHFFFQLSQFKDFLQNWVREGHLTLPIQNKLQEWFDQGIKDWDISRDAPYFGFKIPGTDDKYFYVWLDAPIGYMATTENWCKQSGLSFDEIWKSDQFEIHHFIGKDILYFHALFWPAMLSVAGFSTPTKINVHGFLTINGQKMSKSRGTFVNAKTYLQHLNPEFLRYYYAAKLNATVEDLDLNLDDFVLKINSEVVNKFINIASRLGAIMNKRLENRLSDPDQEGTQILNQLYQSIPVVLNCYETLEFAKAIKEIMHSADIINKYIDEKAPWQVVKEDAEKARQICTSGLNGIRVLAGLLKPVIPEIVGGIERFLAIPSLDFDNIKTPICQHTIADYVHLAQRIDNKLVGALIA